MWGSSIGKTLGLLFKYLNFLAPPWGLIALLKAVSGERAKGDISSGVHCQIIKGKLEGRSGHCGSCGHSTGDTHYDLLTSITVSPAPRGKVSWKMEAQMKHVS